MKVEIKGGNLIITMPIDKEPKASKSGKNIVIASTHGNEKTTCEFNGKPITVGVNAFYKPE